MNCASCGAALPTDARFCPTCGAAVETQPPPVDERKLATVLFADLVGSTALADEADPERVRVLLDRFFDAMTDEIERTGGTVEKFAGDAVMAVFGAPAALEDHAERALHAGLAMQRRVSELFGDELRLRIGVNTGEVVVGQPREGSSFVSGDAVNVAARLEQAAEAGEVLAGERTVVAARGAFEFDDERVVEAKGKPAGIVCRAVVRALTLMRPRGIRGLHRAFVGRETELELLGATFRRAAAQREPHLVTIVGEPGVGKTRLVREVWELLSVEDPAPVRRTGRCLPYGDGITYWPLGEMVKEHLGVLESDSPDEIRRRLGERTILGLALGLDVASGLHPIDAREHLHRTVVDFVQELAVDRPCVILVEDIHWAEDDLLDLLERIAHEALAPVVILGTARPELLARRPTWGAGRRNATTIWLEPLSSDVTSRLLDELLGLELPAELRGLLVERAEGNAFFVEELVGALVDAGVLERSNGGWRAGELPADFSMPDSVHALVAARIDRLPAQEKAALQAGAVVGRTFWPGPVIHLLEGSTPDFDLLEERDFIRRRGGSSMAGEREYAIKHALTREVAYASIPKARRGRLHAALADWLEAQEHAKDEHASLLAYHYTEAVRPEDADLVWAGAEDELEQVRSSAVVWLRRAGELARSRYEMEEAIELLTRATELIPDDHERALLWREIGLCNALRFDGEAFRAAMEKSLELSPDPAARGETYGLFAFHAAARGGMWRSRPDEAVTREWVDHALELADPASRTRARALIAKVYLGWADEEATNEAGAIAERLDDVELRSYALDAHMTIAFDAGRFDDARASVQRRLELAPQIGDPDHLADLYGSGVPVFIATCDFAEARRLANVQDEIQQRLTDHHRVHGISIALELEELLGNWVAVDELRLRTENAVDANLSTPCVRNARSLLVCSVGAAMLGDGNASRALERRAALLDMTGLDLVVRAPRIRLALARGDHSQLAELLASPVDPRSPWYKAADTAALLDGLIALGDRDRIEQRARALLHEGTYYEPFALRALGAARNDDELLSRADHRFRELGLDWHAAQTDALLVGV